eukprot:COSAG01_NODE_565_length_15436_cov_64.116581_12_plen_180_part_00
MVVDEGDVEALIAFAVEVWQPDVYSELDTDTKASPDNKKLKNQCYQWKQRIRKNFKLEERFWDPRYAEFIKAVRCVPPPPPLHRLTALTYAPCRINNAMVADERDCHKASKWRKELEVEVEALWQALAASGGAQEPAPKKSPVPSIRAKAKEEAAKAEVARVEVEAAKAQVATLHTRYA